MQIPPSRRAPISLREVKHYNRKDVHERGFWAYHCIPSIRPCASERCRPFAVQAALNSSLPATKPRVGGFAGCGSGPLLFQLTPSPSLMSDDLCHSPAAHRCRRGARIVETQTLEGQYLRLLARMT